MLVVAACLATITTMAPMASAGGGRNGNELGAPTPGNTSFACTHTAVDWVVPAGVTTVDIVATGASGSASFGGGHAGGLGAKVTGTIAVTAGATLHVRAGCSDGFNGGGGTGDVVCRVHRGE